jgi:hypothetical protein
MFVEAVARYLTKLRSLAAPTANSYKHHAPPELRSETLIS